MDISSTKLWGALGNLTYNLWLAYPSCRMPNPTNPSTTLTYEDAQISGLFSIWLERYMICLADLNMDFSTQRINRAYNNTIYPIINLAVNDFYDVSNPDLTDGAFSNMHLNFSGNSQFTCIGGCYVSVNPAGPLIHATNYDSSHTFSHFATPLAQIDQQAIETAYTNFIDLIDSYIPNRHTVAQPVLTYIYANGDLIGYRWASRIYQQSQDMSHYPR